MRQVRDGWQQVRQQRLITSPTLEMAEEIRIIEPHFQLDFEGIRRGQYCLYETQRSINKMFP